MNTITKVPREARWSTVFFIAAFVALLLTGTRAQAFNNCDTAFLNHYTQVTAGSTLENAANDCTLCHTQPNAGGGQARNPYGATLAGINCGGGGANAVPTLIAAEPLNPDDDTVDGDLCSSIIEINADTLPGIAGGLNGTPANCNSPPVVVNPGDQTNNEGDSAVSLQIVASDIDINDTLTYSANNLPASLSINANTGLIGGNIANDAAASSPYTVTVDVSDGTDITSVTFQWVVIPVGQNQPPVADANGDPNGEYTGFTGQPVTFDGSGSNDPDGTIASYTWSFGDGSPDVTVVTPTVQHTYTSVNTFAVALTVTDSLGASSAPATASAIISEPPVNQPPVADANGVNGEYNGFAGQPVTFDGSGSNDPDGTIASYTWSFGDGSPDVTVATPTVQHTYTTVDTFAVTLTVTDNLGASSDPAATASAIISAAPGGGSPIARGDTYATAVGKELVVQLSRVSGVLYNDFDTDAAGTNLGNGDLEAVLVSGPTAGTLNVSPGQVFNGEFTYTPGETLADNTNDSFTYQARDLDGNLSNPPTTVNIHVYSDQTDFKIMMNYELGMHCTGFEFSYCCVLPPYNSILAQVVRPQPQQGEVRSNADFARLLEGDPNNGLDGLGRETVVRDFEHNGEFKKYYLEYFHDAQPRREGNMPGTFNSNEDAETLISDIEGNSMLYHNTPYDSALVDTDGSITGVPGKLVRAGDPGFPSYNGLAGPVAGDGDYMGATDNYANGWLNHFYIYADLEGTLNGQCVNNNNGTVRDSACANDRDCRGNERCDLSLERNKIRLGVGGMVEYPANVGAALQPMGPISNGQPSEDVVGFDNVLTFSADTGTVVYTQMKVLENLPVMLTSPRIWEALGLPLTPFEDTIAFFSNDPNAGPGSVDEDSIRPYVAMKARLHEAVCDAQGNCTQGDPVMGSNDQPVIGHGTAPIDIPNCERCHSVPAVTNGIPNVNSPSFQRAGEEIYGPDGMTLQAITDLEINYWLAVYPSMQTGSDWYARLKGAAINMLAIHDAEEGTGFLDCYPADESLPGCGFDRGVPLLTASDLPQEKQIPQNTRVGHESVICQKCHGDNVIAAVAPMGQVQDPDVFRPRPISEAIHRTHRNKSEGGPIEFNDGLGRDGGCQGCHPAHRSDGVMDNYPITIAGNNANGDTDGDGIADGDNRLNQGGCFVGRDVHSNPLKDVDGAETDPHLNAVGDWLAENVFFNQATEPGGTEDNRGIWCTNCHTQLGQDIWAAEDCDDLINGVCENDVRGLGSLDAIAGAIGLVDDDSPGGLTREQQAIQMLDPRSDPADPTLPFPGYSEDFTHAIWRADIPDANVATIEVGPDGPVVTTDADGDISVNILSFCTTDDCVQRINDNKGDQSQWRYPANPFIDTANTAVAVPFSAATDGRDHWLSAGEPHCADCHAAPYVEQSGNINPFPPFNYPAKASLMRYSRGHQDLGCQACHESIHGLYPVSAAIDTTSYAQAAALNADGSHGPLKCGACHQVDDNGIPNWHEENGDGDFEFDGGDEGLAGFDNAIDFAHRFTDEADPLDTLCQNCHDDERDDIKADEEEWLEHAMEGRTSRLMMDKAEISEVGHVLGSGGNRELRDLCEACHDDERRRPQDIECNGEWRRHLSQGRVSESVWEEVSLDETGTTCGW